VPTLAEARRQVPWMWVLLLELRSPRGGGAGAPVIIRWGGEASTDRLRARARCTACGGKGASLRHPSWTDSAGGWAMFPASRAWMAATPYLCCTYGRKSV